MYGDVERVDLMIGMYAETPPEGFGFSDTAFRVFILMASRRIKSDRFFTDCFTEEYYTKTGMKWIDDNSMVTVLERHYPELAPALDDVTAPSRRGRKGTANTNPPTNPPAPQPKNKTNNNQTNKKKKESQ